MHRFLSGLLVVLLLFASCNRADEAVTTSTTDPVTSEQPPTSTTTTRPGPNVDVSGLPPDLAAAITNLYLVAMGAGDRAAIPPGVLTALDAAEVGLPDSYEVRAEGHTATVLESEVTVVTAGDDIILVVDDGDGWQIVGAHLAGLRAAAAYGPPIRLVLVVGSDARPGEDAAGARADSLHVVAANPAHGTGAIVGIPRDAWVEPPTGRTRKLTEVLAVSGPDALLETARTTTGLELEGYVLTGFSGFVDLVDEFGTFDIDIPMDMADRASGAYFSAGIQEIDGSEALAFARNRTIPGGDFTRQLHGGVVINWVGRAVQDLGIESLPQMLALLTTHTLTDMTAADLLTMTASLYQLDFDELPNVVVPGRIGTAGSASVVFLEDGAAEVFADLADGVLEIDQPEEP